MTLSSRADAPEPVTFASALSWLLHPDLKPLLEHGTPVFLAVIFLVVFAESGLLVGFFLPGDSLLFAAGLVAGLEHRPHILILLGVAFVGAVLGDQVGYAFGQRTGFVLGWLFAGSYILLSAAAVIVLGYWGETITGIAVHDAVPWWVWSVAGLVFIAATMDKYFRAFDADTGAELWRYELPYSGNATPMTYRAGDGRQYVVIAAGGHGALGTQTGDALMAFALPQ